jgi:hypothetical protein
MPSRCGESGLERIGELLLREAGARVCPMIATVTGSPSRGPRRRLTASFVRARFGAADVSLYRRVFDPVDSPDFKILLEKIWKNLDRSHSADSPEPGSCSSESPGAAPPVRPGLGRLHDRQQF